MGVGGVPTNTTTSTWLNSKPEHSPSPTSLPTLAQRNTAKNNSTPLNGQANVIVTVAPALSPPPLRAAPRMHEYTNSRGRREVATGNASPNSAHSSEGGRTPPVITCRAGSRATSSCSSPEVWTQSMARATSCNTTATHIPLSTRGALVGGGGVDGLHDARDCVTRRSEERAQLNVCSTSSGVR